MRAVGFKTEARTITMMDGVKLFLDKEMASRLLALLQSSPGHLQLTNLDLLRHELVRLGVTPTPGYGFKVVSK